MLRTKFFNKAFRRIANRGKKFWKIFWNIGVVVSFIFIFVAVFFFFSNFLSLLITPKPENALIPLIPGVTISLPMFSQILLPLLIAVTIHEFSHGIAAENDGVEVKSSGIFGAGVFFIIGAGAFVEVDEFQINSRAIKTGTRLRVMAGGVWSNIILALIIFGLLSTFNPMIKSSYSAETFRVTNVLSENDGGFNFNSLDGGEIVLKINGITVDYTVENHSLNDILANKTDLQCGIGDELIFTCLDEETGVEINKTVILGHRSYVGFSTSQVENSVFNISYVAQWGSGGNNYEVISEGMTFNKVNGTAINYTGGITLQSILAQKKSPLNYNINITTVEGKNISISVNNKDPLVKGAYSLENIFLGLKFEKVSDSSIQVIELVEDDTYGINKGKIPVNTILTSINGYSIDLVNSTIKEFFSSLNLTAGDTLSAKDNEGKTYTLNTIINPTHDVVVFIGIESESYWIASNFLGELLGPNFPNWLFNQMTWIFIISFSLALFNLLPVSIFDGGKLFKGGLDILIGTKYQKGNKDKVVYQFDPEETTTHLQTHNIHEIESVNMLQLKEPLEEFQNETPKAKNKKTNKTVTFNPEDYEGTPLEFTPVDSINDGYIDSIELQDVLEEGTMVEVNYLNEIDLIAPKKDKIFKFVSRFIGGIVIGSFIISLIKFGNSLFWI